MGPHGVRIVNANANFARGVAIAVSAVWAAVLFLTGLDLDDGVRRVMVYLPSLIGLLVVAFDLWLWRIPGISKVTGRPHIYGTWQATLTPNAESRIPPGGNWGPIVAAMVIEQTFWTTAIRLHTDQSSSASSTAQIVPAAESKQSKSIFFTYANRARQEHNQRSFPHHGTSLLHVTGIKPRTLEGSYWTDRLTSGDIVLRFISKKVDTPAADALRSAQALAEPL